jgi:hypothetical protein
MFEIDVILIIVLALGATTGAVWHAPEGYEDETGFHFSDGVLHG